LSLEARILALADVFEALTASNRPYKKAKTMTEVRTIIEFMARNNELDRDLVNFFFDKHLHEAYGTKELKREQLV
jgi:HD-GYP domain-containing protein (c-di-GMP phosphodiesterase class II)